MARFEVTVSPGAARTELAGRHGEGWRVRVSAPPERGRANEALVRLLAAALGVPREHVRIAGGHGSRRKIIEVHGLEAAEIARRLS